MEREGAPTVTVLPALRVLADNPSAIDLLGLGAIASAVADVVCGDNGEPITIGIRGPWGSGKSSLLQQVRIELSLRSKTTVVELNPWEIEDQDEVKGTIITAVLDQLHSGSNDPGIKSKLVSLMRRISWTRAAKAIGRGALTMQWNVEELIDAFTPSAEAGHPTSLAGFREQFASVMDDLPVDRVVVLIDDLDRCMPSAVLSTLEAVKLFLAVPKMAFVIAADQEMVRDAIASGLGETRRSAVFARDYLDKIVQVPINVPQPTRDDAECYVALLLAHRQEGDAVDLHGLIAHADNRRKEGVLPYLADAASGQVTPALLQQAQFIVTGLGADEVVNPRRLKRFVNALAVRQHASAASDITLDPAAIAKLFMLEHRFPKQLKQLAESSPQQRKELLTKWEAWANDDTEAGESPGEGEENLKIFFASSPSLAEAETEKYFVLARKLLNVRAVSALSAEATRILTLLLDANPMNAARAEKELEDLTPEEVGGVLLELMSQLNAAPDPNRHLQAIIRAANKGASGQQAAEALRKRRTELTPGTAQVLLGAASDELKALVVELRADPTVPPVAVATLNQKVN